MKMEKSVGVLRDPMIAVMLYSSEASLWMPNTTETYDTSRSVSNFHKSMHGTSTYGFPSSKMFYGMIRKEVSSGNFTRRRKYGQGMRRRSCLLT
jgi:hypothetical protein